MIWATQTVFTSRIKVDKLVSASNLGILTWFKWLILPANISFPDLRCRQVGNPMTPQRCRDLMHQLHLQAMGSQAQSRKSETKTFLNQFLRFTCIAICGRTYVFFLPFISIRVSVLIYPTYILIREATESPFSRWNLYGMGLRYSLVVVAPARPFFGAYKNSIQHTKTT